MNAWLKRRTGPDEIVKIVPDTGSKLAALSYNLYIAFEENYLGRILFDDEGYWIYDGDDLTVTEQEQVAKFIIQHMEVIWNN